MITVYKLSECAISFSTCYTYEGISFLSRLFIKCELPKVNFRSLSLQSAKLRQ